MRYLLAILLLTGCYPTSDSLLECRGRLSVAATKADSAKWLERDSCAWYVGRQLTHGDTLALPEADSLNAQFKRGY